MNFHPCAIPPHAVPVGGRFLRIPELQKIYISLEKVVRFVNSKSSFLFRSVFTCSFEINEDCEIRRSCPPEIKANSWYSHRVNSELMELRNDKFSCEGPRIIDRWLLLSGAIFALRISSKPSVGNYPRSNQKYPYVGSINVLILLNQKCLYGTFFNHIVQLTCSIIIVQFCQSIQYWWEYSHPKYQPTIPNDKNHAPRYWIDHYNTVLSIIIIQLLSYRPIVSVGLNQVFI